MKQFREKHSLVGQGQGGALNGKGVEKVISEKGLSDLTNMLPDSVAEPVVKYLRSIRAVYKICVSKSLDPDYQTVFDEFWKNFLVLKEHPDIQLSMTPKVHDIVHHIPQYFEMTATTLRNTSEAYIETLHQSLARSELRHGCKTRSDYGSNQHVKNILYSTCVFAFNRLGFVEPEMIETSSKCSEQYHSSDHNYS